MKTYPWENESDLRKLFARSSGVNINALGFDREAMGCQAPLSDFGKAWWIVRENSCHSLGAGSFRSLWTSDEQVALCPDPKELWFLVAAPSEDEARELVVQELPFLRTHWPSIDSAELNYLNNVMHEIVKAKFAKAFR